MSDMITAEAAGKLLEGWEAPYADGHDVRVRHDHRAFYAPRLARTVIALHAQLADAKAAQALDGQRLLRRFIAVHTTFHSGTIFTADDRPGWIADWVWKDHVLKLEVGKYLATDFHRIFRVV